MPTLPLRCFGILVCLFLISVGVDGYYSQAKKTGVAALSNEAVNVAVFMNAAQAGELSDGHIIYRANTPGLADLSATSKAGDVTKTIRTTARVTDGDLALLRAQGFAENDAATFAAAQKVSGSERAASIAHGAMHPLGILVVIAAIVLVAQRYGGRFSAFSSHRLQSVTSAEKFSSVAG